MFCADCGTDLGISPVPCPNCGRAPQRAGGAVVAELGQQMRVSSKDAAGLLRTLSVDPVGGLAPAFSQLGPERAGAAGIALCAAFTLIATVGVFFGAQRWLGVWGDVAGMNGAGFLFKTFLALLMVPVALAAAGWTARKLGRAAGNGVAGDLFTAGAAFAPIGSAVLAGGFLGAGNAEIAALLLFCAFSYLVLVLYSGLTGVGSLRSGLAAPMVPAMVVAAAWLAKVVFTALS